MAISKVYDGSSWVTGLLKVYDGADFVGIPSLWDGTQWVNFGVVVTLTDAFVFDTNAFALSTAGVGFNPDGTVDEIKSSGTTQINPDTDWIIPNSAASSDYEIKCTYSGDTPSGSATGTWLSMSTLRQWYVTDNTSGPTSTQSVLTIEIRKNGGPVIATGEFTINANRSDF